MPHGTLSSPAGDIGPPSVKRLSIHSAVYYTDLF
jgi:hypothetical protein